MRGKKIFKKDFYFNSFDSEPLHKLSKHVKYTLYSAIDYENKTKCRKFEHVTVQSINRNSILFKITNDLFFELLYKDHKTNWYIVLEKG